jgi:hypothetical protein
MTPLNPCSPTTRSSSATAAGGSAIGSAARPKNRVGWLRIASASDVCASRKGLGLLDIELLDAGRGQRKRLDVDASGVHCRDATVRDVDELINERREPPANLSRLLL